MFDDAVLAKLKEHESKPTFCNVAIAIEREKEYSGKEVVGARRARTTVL